MPAKPKFDPRKMMAKAIEVMKLSVVEPRGDKKASPKVGAVLVKPDGTIDTAYRGELRHGDHAEYTLLERKHRDERLDGGVLFATLEPCAPGARKHPKLPCAERIVNARIAKVWVGIEDPDPAVDGHGIRYLEENGVEVAFFDVDMQEKIRNRKAQRHLKQLAKLGLLRKVGASSSTKYEVPAIPAGAICRPLPAICPAKVAGNPAGAMGETGHLSGHTGPISSDGQMMTVNTLLPKLLSGEPRVH